MAAFVKCDMCSYRISTADPKNFLNHLNQEHSNSPSFFHICTLDGCKNSYHRFVSYKRHFYKAHFKRTTSILANPICDLDIESPAVQETPRSHTDPQNNGQFDDTTVDSCVQEAPSSPEEDRDQSRDLHNEWKSGFYLFLHSKYFVNFHCLELIDNALEEYSQRKISELKEELKKVIPRHVAESDAYKNIFTSFMDGGGSSRLQTEKSWTQHIPTTSPKAVDPNMLSPYLQQLEPVVQLHVDDEQDSSFSDKEEIIPTSTKSAEVPYHIALDMSSPLKAESGSMADPLMPSQLTSDQEVQIPVPIPELTPQLRCYLERKEVHKHYKEFVSFFADHLWQRYQNPTKATYGHYARQIVEKYPQFQDEMSLNMKMGKGNRFHPWSTISKRISKFFQNRRSVLTNKEKLKCKRLKQVTQSDANDSIEEADNDMSATTKTFDRRREIFKELKTSSIKIITGMIGDYKQFDSVFKDGLQLMGITEDRFSAKLNDFILHSRKYLEIEKQTRVNSDLEVIIEINRLCSSLKGVKMGIPPVLQIQQVAENPTYQPAERFPYSVVYCDNGLPKTQAIVCTEDRHFIVELDKECNPLLNLLAVYYTFNIRFPAMYGILSLIDDICLESKNGEQPQSCLQFKEKFFNFLAANNGTPTARDLVH